MLMCKYGGNKEKKKLAFHIFDFMKLIFANSFLHKWISITLSTKHCLFLKNGQIQDLLDYPQIVISFFLVPLY